MNTKNVWMAFVFVGVGIAVGYGVASLKQSPAVAAGKPTAKSLVPDDTAPPQKAEKRVLYWYDPMMPQQHFDKPGKSPFMDMDLQPKYAEADSTRPGLNFPQAAAQTLGIRVATVAMRKVNSEFSALGQTQLDGSQIAVVQARTGGFVRHVVSRTPGEIVAAGSTLLDFVAPEWTAAQQEFLTLRNSGDVALVDASRQRLLFLGMDASMIKRLEKTGTVQTPVVSVPITGVLQDLNVRDGMAISPGMTLATINATSSLWVEVAVPETQAGNVFNGQHVAVSLPSQPDNDVRGVVKAILPQGNAELRTLRIRIAIPNSDGNIQAGLSVVAQFQSAVHDALVIPSEAVIRTGTRSLVYVVGDDKKYRPVAVSVGSETGGMTVIEEGLEEGQRVVTSGQFLIDSEASLQGIFPADINAESEHPEMQP